MDDKFVLLTDNINVNTYVEANDIKRIRGGLRPSCDGILWYNPPSSQPEYYSKWHEYKRLDLEDGRTINDEILDDGKYNPGTKYVIYGSLKQSTIRIRPSKIKDILAEVNKELMTKEVSDYTVRQSVAKLVSKKLKNPSIKYVICEIANMEDVIVLEDIFAVIDSVDAIEHDILKKEIKLYLFDPHSICHVSEEDKYEMYLNIKKRIESGFYEKKLKFLELLRYDKSLEPKTRNSYLRNGVMLEEGETAEQCYDRIKFRLRQVYSDFEKYKDNYEEFKINILNKIPRAISTERNEWDRRYNDEVITTSLVQGYVKFFSGIYISEDAEMNICESEDKRRRFRYNRGFEVTSLGIFNSDAMELEKVIDIEEIKEKNVLKRKQEIEKNQEKEQIDL